VGARRQAAGGVLGWDDPYPPFCVVFGIGDSVHGGEGWTDIEYVLLVYKWIRSKYIHNVRFHL
jgi:hypothetical protein